MAGDSEQRLSQLEASQAAADARLEAFIRSNKEFIADFRAEMRQQNEMRAREIAEIRAKQDAQQAAQQAKYDADMNEIRRAQAEQQAKHDADMKELRQDIQNTQKEIRNLLIAFVGIIVAIIVGMFWNPPSNKNSESVVKSERVVETSNEKAIARPLETAER